LGDFEIKLAGKSAEIPGIFFEEYFKMLQEILCKASFEVKNTVNMDSLEDSARRKLCKLKLAGKSENFSYFVSRNTLRYL
jgi:hypothetical protein